MGERTVKSMAAEGQGDRSCNDKNLIFGIGALISLAEDHDRNEQYEKQQIELERRVRVKCV